MIVSFTWGGKGDSIVLGGIRRFNMIFTSPHPADVMMSLKSKYWTDVRSISVQGTVDVRSGLNRSLFVHVLLQLKETLWLLGETLVVFYVAEINHGPGAQRFTNHDASSGKIFFFFNISRSPRIWGIGFIWIRIWIEISLNSPLRVDHRRLRSDAKAFRRHHQGLGERSERADRPHYGYTIDGK